MVVEIHKNEQAVLDSLKQHIERIANESITSRDSFCVGLSGENFLRDHKTNQFYFNRRIANFSRWFTFEVFVSDIASDNNSMGKMANILM